MPRSCRRADERTASDLARRVGGRIVENPYGCRDRLIRSSATRVVEAEVSSGTVFWRLSVGRRVRGGTFVASRTIAQGRGSPGAFARRFARR